MKSFSVALRLTELSTGPVCGTHPVKNVTRLLFGSEFHRRPLFLKSYFVLHSPAVVSYSADKLSR